MASVCISNCVNDARDPRVPVRATYVNLYKWPESEAEFVRSNGRRGCHVYGPQPQQPRVVDSISCRQMYLRSYKFSRKEECVSDKITQKCFGGHGGRNKKKRMIRRRRRSCKCLIWRKMRGISCALLFRIFRKFLSCAATVYVVDEKD